MLLVNTSTWSLHSSRRNEDGADDVMLLADTFTWILDSSRQYEDSVTEIGAVSRYLPPEAWIVHVEIKPVDTHYDQIRETSILIWIDIMVWE